ncbi:hypothetical protein [Plastoroseomonas arctica]|uniref:Uncharacterized protein n=1 Tax=Plastoroseomonas arctica TaxID=1509237 RepID=A0AAF1JUC4_9PROT|nr:hypothetical protein [Plastoroseomonas arctica]MBR0653797.1 hypothetical protein [Plastoroseomonas arctica]
MIRALILALLLAPPALAQTLFDAGRVGMVEMYRPQSGEDDRPQLRLVRGGQRLWQTRAWGFEVLDPPLRTAVDTPMLTGITGWSGGAYCCWTLHVFARTAQGLAHAGDIPLGKRSPEHLRLQEPDSTLIRIADPAHDFWDYVSSLGADIGPLVPFAWDGRRLAADAAAMRRASAADCPAVPTPDPGSWSRFNPGQPNPATELARASLCRIYIGQAASVDQVLALFPAEERALREATERQMKARLACSTHAAILRRINDRTPLIPTTCRQNGPDYTAVSTLLERRPSR